MRLLVSSRLNVQTVSQFVGTWTIESAIGQPSQKTIMSQAAIVLPVEFVVLIAGTEPTYWHCKESPLPEQVWSLVLCWVSSQSQCSAHRKMIRIKFLPDHAISFCNPAVFLD